MNTPKQAVVLGSKSGIYQSIKPLMAADGWQFFEWNRNVSGFSAAPNWDLVLVPMGKISPVGIWHDKETSDFRWTLCFESNVILPFMLLRSLWKQRLPGARVCFFAGSNPNMIMPGYSAYNVSKMALLKLVEQIDYETPDHVFFALNPGIVLTKIHDQSGNWLNPKLAKAREANQSTPPERIYAALKWCLEKPKSVVGGRNICVSDFQAPTPLGNYDDLLARHLYQNPSMYKLRRDEG